MNKIKVGDWVTVDDVESSVAFRDCTEGKKYEVINVSGEVIIFKDDVDEKVCCTLIHLTLAPKTTPRPHAELIKKWADDNMVIEFFRGDSPWFVIEHPLWHPNIEYREKPTEPTERDLIMQEIQEDQDKLNVAKKRLEGVE